MRENLPILALAMAVVLTGCGDKNSPSSPGGNGNPSPTETATVTSTPTACLSCTHTFTGTATGTPTSTSSPTSTPTVTVTSTETMTSTATPTITPSSTVTDTPTSTPTASLTSTPTTTSTPCSNTGSQGDAPSTACCPAGLQKNYTFCRPITLAQTSLAYQIQLYVSGPCSFLQAGLYADNGSHYPGNRIAESAPLSVPGTANQVYSLSFPATSLSAGTYWMAVYGNDPGPFVYLRLSPTSGDSYFDDTGVPLPATFEASTGINYVSNLIEMQTQYCY